MRVATAIWSAVLAGFILSAVCASVASAGTVTDQRPFLFAFDGSDAESKAFDDPMTIAIDNVSQSVYVADSRTEPLANPTTTPKTAGAVVKFTPAGVANDYSFLSSASLFGPEVGFSVRPGVAVDNSGGPRQGHLYVTDGGATRAYDATGREQWTELGGSPCDVAIDDAGMMWTGNTNDRALSRWAVTATGRSLLGTLSLVTSDTTCRFDVDRSGASYVRYGGAIHRYTGGPGGVFDVTLDPGGADVYTDQSKVDGHIFTIRPGEFREYDSLGNLVGAYGGDYVRAESFFNRSIAYNPVADRVYVIQKGDDKTDPHPLVAVYGPPASGTVPDPIISAPSGVTIAEAGFSGLIDSQGQVGNYIFEWKRADSTWAASNLPTARASVAGSSPPQSLPAGPGPIPVSFSTDQLRGGTTYDVRLATISGPHHLRAVSSSTSFTTDVAASQPDVTIDSISDIGPRSVTVNATVNPKEDSADWRIQLQKSCNGGYVDVYPQYSSSASPGPTPVSGDAVDLLPSQAYCARVIATNSGGSATSAPLAFTTTPIVPSGSTTAFAAPRTQERARLNGYVNPEGAGFSYHFEFSSDEGQTWASLPNVQMPDGDTRHQVLVSQELSGLESDSVYRYRLVVENSAGPGTPNAGAREFRTRTAAEMELPKRGVELVNNPDKGNQTAVASAYHDNSRPFSINGEALQWIVRSGAPGAPTGTGAAFLAQRTETSWVSTSILPPASRLEGEGVIPYTVPLATPTLERFLVTPGSHISTPPFGALYRYDRHHNGEKLAHYPDKVEWIMTSSNIATTTDLDHVLRVELETKRLVDVGTGVAETVGVLPDGSTPPCGVDPGRGFFSTGGGPSGRHGADGQGWMDLGDARRVFFLAKPGPDCGGPYNLYLRDRTVGETTLIASGDTQDDLYFIRASRDGRAALFTSDKRRVVADTNPTRDIYKWTEGAGLVCVTCVVASAEVRLERILATADLSHVYFESKGVLEPPLGRTGAKNIYVWHDDQIQLVASSVSQVDTLFGGFGRQPILSDDGKTLLFTDSSALTADVHSGTMQLYRYFLPERSLECVSCRQDGPTTGAVGGEGGGNSNDNTFDASADGETIVFSTRAALLPRDVNQRLDVYEWRNGRLGLITDGVTEFNAGSAAPGLIGIDRDATDIFFSVAQPGLTGHEQDGVANIYDARVGGGFPPPPPPTPCEGDACQGPLQAAPDQIRPSSMLFNGGDQGPQSSRPKGCVRGKIKRKGRCVSRTTSRPKRCRGKAKAVRKRCVRSSGDRRARTGANSGKKRRVK